MMITNPRRIAQAILILATTLLLCKDVQGGAGGVLRGNKRALSRIESSSTNANEAVDTSLNARLLEEDVKPNSNNGKGKNKNGKNKGNKKGKNGGGEDIDVDLDDDADALEENNNDNSDNQNSSPTGVPETDNEADDDLIADKDSEETQAVDVENIVAGSAEDDEDDYYDVEDGQDSKSEDNEITNDDKILDIEAEEEEATATAKEVEDITPEPTIKATIAPTIKTSSPTMATSSPTKAPTVSPTIAATPAPTTSSPTKSLTNSPTKATPSPTKLVTILKTASPTKKVTATPTRKVTATPTRKVTAEPTKMAVIDDGDDDGDDEGYQLIPEKVSVDDNFEADDDRSFPSEPKSINSIEDIYDNLSPEEIDFLKHMERVDEEEEAAKISIVYFFITAALMVFTAHQLSENPDGVYSNICRLMITVTGVFFKIILLPARKFGWIGSKSGYAHHLVTTQTDFKDPYSRTNRMEII